MNALVRALARVSKNQRRNLAEILRGRPPVASAFSCMTLEPSDLEFARAWLTDRSRWDQEDIVRHFGAAFAQQNGSRAAFAFASGREALSAAVQALALTPGAEVVLPGYTCIAVPNALRFAGALPVFADIELETYGLSVAAAERALTPRTRAILIQHSYGLVSRDYEALLDLARAKGLHVIEDCAHATGAELDGVRVGNRGDVAIYSTERSKVLCTMRGGLVSTNEPVLAQRLDSVWRDSARSDHAQTERLLTSLIVGYYRHKAPLRAVLGDLVDLWHAGAFHASTTEEELRSERPHGYGARMAPALAALGLLQLPRLEHYSVLRRAAARRWDGWARDEGLVPPVIVARSVPALLRYPVLVDPRQKRDTRWIEQALGVQAGRWFETNLHPVEARVDGCPNADHAVERCINLPTLVA